MRQALAVILVAMGVWGGCGDDKGIVEAKAPGIEVREGESPIPRATTLLIADTLRMTVTNVGAGDLQVRALELTSESDAFDIVASTLPAPGKPIVVAPAGTWMFEVTYDADAVLDGQRARANVRIATNTTLPDGLDSFSFAITPEAITSKLVLQPASIDFARVESGTSSTKPLNLLNKGAAALTIDRVQLAGASGYTAMVAGVSLTSANGALVTLPQPIVLAPGSARQVDVTFASIGSAPADATLTFFSDDPAAPNGNAAPLYANLVGPCLRAVPSRVDFGAKEVGQLATTELLLESCGDLQVEVTSVALADNGGGVFALDLSGIQLPLRLAPGIRKAIPVTYFPEAFAALGSDGQYIQDRGRIRVTSNAYLQSLEIETTGFGSGCCCPVAVIDVAPASDIVPQTELVFTSGSSSAGGEVTRWEWSVIQPDGSLSQFYPSASVASPRFKPNIIGTYIFRLDVYDATGTKSCAPAEKIIEVRSDDALHVELLWRTPGDINETDEGTNANFSAGSDVDLHFLHPFAAGKYFDEQYDCSWLEPFRDWGPVGDVGNPSLDRDDRDGGGPENLNMKTPEDGALYTVGVHYFNDWGYGSTFATIRIYIYGVLREQWSEVQIIDGALWESHQIEWPSARVTRVLVNEQPKIIPGYPVP